MIYSFLAIIFAICFCLFSFKIISLRRSEKIGIGTGDSEALSRWVAASRNFFEYGIIFIMLAFIAQNNNAVSSASVLAISALFVSGRIIHFISLTKIEPESILNKKPNFKFRIFGMALTFTSILALSFLIFFSLIL